MSTFAPDFLGQNLPEFSVSAIWLQNLGVVGHPNRRELKSGGKASPARVRDLERATLGHPDNPFEFKQAVQDGRPELPGKMRSALAPIEARPAKRPFGSPIGRQVYPEISEELRTLIGDDADAIDERNISLLA